MLLYLLLLFILRLLIDVRKHRFAAKGVEKEKNQAKVIRITSKSKVS